MGVLQRVPLYDRIGVDLLSKTPNRKVEYVLLKRIEFNSFITLQRVPLYDFAFCLRGLPQNDRKVGHVASLPLYDLAFRFVGLHQIDRKVETAHRESC